MNRNTTEFSAKDIHLSGVKYCQQNTPILLIVLPCACWIGTTLNLSFSEMLRLFCVPAEKACPFYRINGDVESAFKTKGKLCPVILPLQY